MTWSCWNITDIVRTPQKDTFLWKGGSSLPRKLDVDSNKFHEIFAEGLADDTELHRELEELCHSIDQKDHELYLILQQILRIARRNTSNEEESGYKFSSDADNDLIERKSLQPDLDSKSPSPSKVTGPPGSNPSQDTRSKRGNIFSRILRAIRRRFNRGNETAKN